MVFTIISAGLSNYPSNNYILKTTSKQKCSAYHSSLEDNTLSPKENIAYNTEFQTN